jgi:hypothetical protein
MEHLIPEGGTGNKIIEWVNKYFDWYFGILKDGIKFIGDGFKLLFGWIVEGIKAILPFGENIGKGVKDFKSNILKFWDFLTSIWDGIIGWLKSKLPDWALDKIGITNETTTPTPIPPIVDLTDYTNEHERRKIVDQNEKEKKREEKEDRRHKETTTLAYERGYDRAQRNNVLAAQGGSNVNVDNKQIPDEIDNSLINIKNLGWDF